MKFKKVLSILTVAMTGMSFIMAGCSADDTGAVEETTANNTNIAKGAEFANTLAATSWQGTRVYDATGTDLTSENANFIGLAKYDAATNYYEFFDKDTKASQGDEGTFFITADGTKRVLISQTEKYQSVVDIKTLTNEMFTYKRQGVDKSGNKVDVFVDHIPYSETQLAFTNGRKQDTGTSGNVDMSKPGREILGSMLWSVAQVKDGNGNDVTDANKTLLNQLAKFDPGTNRYEFFAADTGQSSGDYGYFDTVDNNRLLALAPAVQDKKGAVLPIMELSTQKFTCKSIGQDANGNDTEHVLEYQPYAGTTNPTFTVF